MRSPASNLPRAKSSDFCMSALIRWVISLFRSMERPSSWTCLCFNKVSYRLARGNESKYVPRARHSTLNRLSSKMLKIEFCCEYFYWNEIDKLPGCKLLVMSKNLLTQLIDKLIKTQIDFSLHLVVQKLFAENSQRIMSTVVVQVQWIQNIPVENMW